MKAAIQKRIHDSPQHQVNLMKCEITDAEIAEITDEIIAKRPSIQEIFLESNQLTDEGAKVLADKLSNLKQLRFIDLQFNQIDKEGMKALISQLLPSHPDLMFAFHGNKIIDSGVMDDIMKEALGRD